MQLNLLSLLTEAAQIDLDKLKDAMKKDGRVSMIFSRNLSLDQIENPTQFLTTLKFYFFNNENVRRFLSGPGANFINSWEFDVLKKLTPAQLTDIKLERLQNFIGAFFRSLSNVKNNKLPAALEKELNEIIPISTGFFVKPSSALVSWLHSMKMRPSDKSVVLYYPVFLTHDDFVFLRTPLNDNEVKIPDGFKSRGSYFMSRIRPESDQISFKLLDTSRWFYDFEEAKNIAKNGYYANQHTRLRNGFVIKARIDSEKILFDTKVAERLGVIRNASNPDMAFLVPGEFIGKIVFYVTPEGEISPKKIKSAESDDGIVPLLQLDFIKSAFDLSWVADKLYSDSNRYQFLKDPQNRIKLEEEFDQVMEVLRSIYKSTTPEVLNKIFSDPQHEIEAKILFQLISLLNASLDREVLYNSKEKDTIKVLESSAAEIKKRFKLQPEFQNTLSYYINDTRFTDWESANYLNRMFYMLDLPHPPNKLNVKINQRSKSAQMAVFKQLIDQFYARAGLPNEDSRAVQAKRILDEIEMIKGYTILLSLLNRVHTIINETT